MKDGISLNDASNVGSYSAGIESNPFFMFDTSVMDSTSPTCAAPPMGEGKFSGLQSMLARSSEYVMTLFYLQISVLIFVLLWLSLPVTQPF